MASSPAAATDAPRLALLGAAELAPAQGRPAWRFLPERRYRLLAYLAVRGAWVGRDELATLFWPDRPQAAARSNLRKLLLEVRALDVPQVESDRGALRWPVASDLAAFDAALAAGDVDAALGLYGGPALHGLDGGDSEAFDAWLDGERARRHSAWRSAALAALPRREPAAALRIARTLLDADPFDEDAVVAALGARHALGDEGGAAEDYRRYGERLLDAFGVEPSQRVRHAREHGARGRRAGDARPAASPAAAVSTSEGFVGRADELRELAELLRNPACRLLTVTGPGGMGKSRLVKEVVRLHAARYADGVLWIALDDLHEVAQVAPRIGAELGLSIAATQAPEARVAAALEPRHCLIVLDNAEHLPGLATLIERLLDAAPRLQVLSTSRARIGVAREWLLPLAGLVVPADDGPASGPSDAVRLFVAQARSMQPRFDAAAHAPQVARLVRALGGLPLAILLAASWVRLLPVAELVNEVTHSLDVLQSAEEGEERPEHRSVQATFEQSWRLLAPAEQRALAALSVMVGGFSHRAAVEVAQAPLPLLAALVDKSLLAVERDGRFAFHPLLLRFVAGKASADAAALDAARARHAAFYCAALTPIDERLPAHANRAAADAVEADFENHRRAWWQACQYKDANALTTGAAGLAHFCEMRGRWRDGVDLFRQAADAMTGELAPPLRARAVCLTRLAHLLGRQAVVVGAESTAHEALRLARGLRLSDEIRRNLLTIARTLADRGEGAKARPYANDALARARRAAAPADVAHALSLVAVLDKQQGRYDEAAAGFQQALGLRQELGDALGVASSLVNLGSMYRAQKQTEKALPLFERVLRLAEEHALHSERAFALTHLALGHYALQHYESTRRYGHLALAAARTSGQGHLEPSAHAALARCATAEGDPRTAKQHLDQMLHIARDKSLLTLQLAGLAIFAELLGHNGQTLRAATLLAFVMGHPKATEGDRHGARDLLDELGIAEAERTQGAVVARTLELGLLIDSVLVEAAPTPP